jgi:hypothetical protein
MLAKVAKERKSMDRRVAAESDADVAAVKAAGSVKLP